jgi:hypothetical protein
MRSTERRASLRAVVPLRVRVWSHMVPFSSSEKICSTICLASHISFFGEHSGTYTRSGPEETAGRRPQHAGILRSSCVHGPARSTGRTRSLAVWLQGEHVLCLFIDPQSVTVKKHRTEACVRACVPFRETDGQYSVNAAPHCPLHGHCLAVSMQCPHTRVALVKMIRGTDDAQKNEASRWLCKLAENDNGNRQGIVKVGGIPALIDLTITGSGEQKFHASNALRHLAASMDIRAKISEAGAIPPLVVLATAGDDPQKLNAAAALRALASGLDDNKLAIAEAGGITPLVEMLQSGYTREHKENAAGALQNLATLSDNQLAIVQAGGLGPLIAMTASDSPDLKFKACGMLLNMSGNENIRRDIVQAGAIAPLVALARSGPSEHRKSATGVLQNLSLDADAKEAIESTGFDVSKTACLVS